MKQKNTIGGRIFDVCNVIVLTLLMIICIYPLYYVVMASFSNAEDLMMHSGILLKPAGFSLEAYKVVLQNKEIYVGYGNTIYYVIMGSALTILVNTMFAYTLSLKNLYYTKYLMIMLTITMFFGGGLIPLYLVVKSLGLLDTRAVVYLPGLVGVFNVIILRTAFMGLPDGLIDAAKIDGANDFYIYGRIVMPLSLATIAVLALFSAVGHWNSWFFAMIFNKNRDFYPLQLFLREILINNQANDVIDDVGVGQRAAFQKVIEHATVIVSTAPILCAYPFAQKYFVKGTLAGAVKG